jgi:hypothetical protein
VSVELDPDSEGKTEIKSIWKHPKTEEDIFREQKN